MKSPSEIAHSDRNQKMTDLSLFDKVTLTSHPHADEGVCAMELLHLVATGVIENKTPKSLTVCCAMLSGLDLAPWRDNTQRTAVLIPYLRRLMSCVRDKAADTRRAFGLANYACRMLLPEFLDAIGKGRTAIQLRTLLPILDTASGHAAVKVVKALVPTAYVDRDAFPRGTRVLLDDAIRNACCNASEAANHAVEGYPGEAARQAGTAALWVARAICYGSATPLSFWGSQARTLRHALTDRAGLAAGGAAVEQYARAMLDIILETQ
jgi:hypothetical protein